MSGKAWAWVLLFVILCAIVASCAQPPPKVLTIKQCRERFDNCIQFAPDEGAEVCHTQWAHCVLNR